MKRQFSHTFISRQYGPCEVYYIRGELGTIDDIQLVKVKPKALANVNWTKVLLMTAAVWFILLGGMYACFADGLKNAGALAVDKVMCKIPVSQDVISYEIAKGMIEHDVKYSDAIMEAARFGGELQRGVISRDIVAEYCDVRRRGSF